MTQTHSCPKCNGEMVAGFVIDMSHMRAFTSQWSEGAPERDSFLGFKIGGNVINPPVDTIPIGTFRCKSCGYLESYARDEFAPK